jgi:hypothetical protein
VLVREQAAGAAEPRLHLVDTEERPVPPAQLLGALEIARRRQVDALALHRLDEKQRHVLGAQLPLERVEVAERHLGESGEQRPESLGELRIAVGGERPERQAMEAVIGRDHPRATRRGAAELDRGLHRLRPGGRELNPADASARPADELVREDRRQGRDAELRRAGQIQLQRLGEHSTNPGVVAPDVEHAEAAEHVEEAGAVGVDQVRTLRARPAAVEADRLENADELRVDRARPSVGSVAAA